MEEFPLIQLHKRKGRLGEASLSSQEANGRDGAHRAKLMHRQPLTGASVVIAVGAYIIVRSLLF
jgi:hypothetical protein